MLGDLTTKEVEDLLFNQVVGRIGCHSEGITYVVPISYAYDGKCVYARTQEGLKIQLMRKNPLVCFEIEEMKDMANWKSVIAWGEFEELTETAQRNKELQLLIDRKLPVISSETTHLSPHWPFPVESIDMIKGIVFRICLHKKSGRFETNISQPYLTT